MGFTNTGIRLANIHTWQLNPENYEDILMGIHGVCPRGTNRCRPCIERVYLPT